MKRTRLGTCLLFAITGIALVAMPAAAQTSTTSGLINSLNERLLIIAIPITLLVEGILIYTVVKYKDNDEPEPTKENRRLEITWTIATAVILLFVGVASYGVLANEDVTYTSAEPAPEGEAVEVEVIAYQWGWEMNYPNQNITNLQGSDTSVTEAAGPVIVVPTDRPVYFSITSEDVIHAFHVPKLGLKQDAIPGQRNTIRTTPLEPGTYQGYCAEYCGVSHSQMLFKVIVVPGDDYESFLSEQTAEPTTNSSSTRTSAVRTGGVIVPG